MKGKDEGIAELSQFALECIRRAGEHALSYYGRGQPDVKFDEGLVTEAELHLTETFQSELHDHYPEHRIFKNIQTSMDYTHEGGRYLWVYDPLDGVANFQAGIPVWGMSLALLENFWPVFGVCHMPVTGDMFHACAGDSAFRGDAAIRVSAQDGIDDESLLLTYSRFHQHYRTKFPGKVRDMGCTTAHICYVAMGRAEAAIVNNESFQGLAAARVILEAAGGKFFKMDGSEVHLNEYLNGLRIDDRLIIVSPNRYLQVRRCIEGIV
ncbi:MAG: inositol monophosphatase [Deltaproteobacteria bacterium]|nr:inositol monophosphatase [Deltaproteobacteria bacterium]